jgi:glycosyltransferase involved in cell wall biosynthesis
MVATASLAAELTRRGFRNVMSWSRGVDRALFRPRPGEPPFNAARPVFLYVGRVAVEKNIDAFLALDLPGSKVVVGEGPALARLKAAHPEVLFTGLLTGEALARAYSRADVFVFPSRTDTYGIVLLEALASGVPVAAYPVAGPPAVIGPSGGRRRGDQPRQHQAGRYRRRARLGNPGRQGRGIRHHADRAARY